MKPPFFLVFILLGVASRCYAQDRLLVTRQGVSCVSEILTIGDDSITFRRIDGLEMSLPFSVFPTSEQKVIRSWTLSTFARLETQTKCFPEWTESPWSDEVNGMSLRLSVPAEGLCLLAPEGTSDANAGAPVKLDVRNASQDSRFINLQDAAYFWEGRRERNQLLQTSLQTNIGADRPWVKVPPGEFASILVRLFPMHRSDLRMPLDNHQVVAGWKTNHSLRTPPVPVKFTEGIFSEDALSHFLRQHRAKISGLAAKSSTTWDLDQLASQTNCPVLSFQGELFRVFQFRAQKGILLWAFLENSACGWFVVPASSSQPNPTFPGQDTVKVRSKNARADGKSFVIQAVAGLSPGQDYLAWLKLSDLAPIPMSLNFASNFTNAKDYASRMTPP